RAHLFFANSHCIQVKNKHLFSKGNRFAFAKSCNRPSDCIKTVANISHSRMIRIQPRRIPQRRNLAKTSRNGANHFLRCHPLVQSSIYSIKVTTPLRSPHFLKTPLFTELPSK